MRMLLLAALLLVGCSEAPPGLSDASSAEDPADASLSPPQVDAGLADAAAGDAGEPDAGAPDAGAADADAEPPDAAALDPEGAFAAQGFSVAHGSYGAVDLSACCASGATCYANNPASPYFAVWLPEGPGQTAPNPPLFDDAAGRSAAFRLRRDEVVLLLGPEPPRSAYVGYTPYVYDRADGSDRAIVFASVSDTLNQEQLDAAGAPGRSIAVVLTGDEEAQQRASAALDTLGVAAGDRFFLPWVVTGGSPSRPLAFGLDASADTFSVLTRVALPEDAAEFAAWAADPQVKVLRLTPRSPLDAGAPAAFPVREPRSSPEDPALAGALDELESAIRSAAPTLQPPVALAISDAAPDPIDCLSSLRNCNGDNRDTPYPMSVPFLFPDENDFLMVFGVNHAATGKTRYSSVGVYTAEHLLGVTSVASPQLAGSAEAFVPANPFRSQLYAWKFARSCVGETACTVVPQGSCPQGVADGAASFLMLRDYVDPATGTRPLWSDLVPDRVLRFRKR